MDAEFAFATPDEPLAADFSPVKASQALDASALWWQQAHGCCHCHANMLYLVARPSLDTVHRSDGKVREFFESLVTDRWEKSGLRYEPEALVVAVPLAIHDSLTSGKLHPATRKALDRMVSLQRPEGNWTLRRTDGSRVEVAGERRAFSRAYEQMLFAAIGIAAAPEKYAETQDAREALNKIRRHVRAHPPSTPHQKAMALWASSRVDGLLDERQREQAIADVMNLQSEDGGWATENLVAGSPTFDSIAVLPNRRGDGYATGLVIFTARRAGVPAMDDRVQRGIKWLKSNQRESGRWFVPSFNKRPNNLLSFSATAYAVLALESCGELVDR